jgi:hypothetical protein
MTKPIYSYSSSYQEVHERCMTAITSKRWTLVAPELASRKYKAKTVVVKRKQSLSAFRICDYSHHTYTTQLSPTHSQAPATTANLS